MLSHKIVRIKGEGWTWLRFQADVAQIRSGNFHLASD